MAREFRANRITATIIVPAALFRYDRLGCIRKVGAFWTVARLIALPRRGGQVILDDSSEKWRLTLRVDWLLAEIAEPVRAGSIAHRAHLGRHFR